MIGRLIRTGRRMVGRTVNWPGALSIGMALALMGGSVALAATVGYGTPNQSVANAIVTPMENTAATIRAALVGVLLLVAVIGVVMRAMIHNPQLQMAGTRAITISIESILVLVFLPLILGWLAGFNVPLLPSG